MRNFAIQMLMALACLYPGLAKAADCPLKLVNSVPIAMAAEGRRVLVPVTINGTQKQFLLDTGGAFTQISAEAAAELKLPQLESGIKMLDLYGNASTRAAKADTFVLGHLRDRNTQLPIMTFKENELFPAFSQPITWANTISNWISPAAK